MIDLKELRRGNLVKISNPQYGEKYEFIPFDLVEGSHGYTLGFQGSDGDGAIHCYDAGSVDPIPITPEWLDRLDNSQFTNFGINVTDDPKPIFNNGVQIDTSHDKKRWRVQIDIHQYKKHWRLIDGIKSVEIEYVHQLQNIFYDFHGHELTIKKQS